MTVLDDELSPETQKFRAALQQKWAFIMAARDDYFSDAKKYTDAGTALRAADKHVRPEVRMFVFDLLSRVPAGELPDFLRRFPPTWPDTTEVLLSEPVVTSMIARSFPHRQQAQNLDAVSLAVAQDNALWSASLKEFAETTGTLLTNAAETAGDVARTVAWVPVVLAGSLGLGAVIVGATYVFRRF